MLSKKEIVELTSHTLQQQTFALFVDNPTAQKNEEFQATDEDQNEVV